MALFSGELISWCDSGDGQQRLQKKREAVVHRVGNFDVLIAPVKNNKREN
jgi:hypothetical protein